MNPKTFSKFFVNTFLFGIVLLCLVGIASTNVNAQQLTINKNFCESIGQQNTCNGNLTFGDGITAGTVNFTITEVTVVRNADGGVETVTPVAGTSQTVMVKIEDNNNSSGTSRIDLKADTDFIVCEVPPDGFTPTPRPDSSTGGSNQSTPPRMPNCILFNSGKGNNNVNFLNTKTAAPPTAATATVSGRLRDINGKPAARVAVTIANVETGEVLSTRTDLFGRYSFTELPTGEDYLLRVFSRRHAFGVNEILINLLEDLTDANFTTGSGRMSIAGR